MENYLTKFKIKHSLSDDECKEYGESDIMFDIDLDMPVDALEQWDEYKKKNGYISFANWTGVDNGYTPRNVDMSGMDELHSEFNGLLRNIERSFEEAFAPFYEDDSDSDSEFVLDENYIENE